MSGAVAAALGLLIGVNSAVAATNYRVAVILDHDSETSGEDYERLEAEIDAVALEEHPVELEAIVADSNTTLDDAFGAFDSVVTLGSLGTAKLARRKNVPKPAIGLSLLDAELQEVPLDACRSQRANLLLLHEQGRLIGDLQAFSTLFDGAALGLLLDDDFAALYPGLESRLSGLMPDGVDVSVVVAGDGFSEELDGLVGRYAGMVLFGTRFSTMSDVDVAEALVERGVAPLSLGGIGSESSMLASTVPGLGQERLFRRAALEIRQLAAGAEGDVAGLDACVAGSDGLTINMRVARLLGFSPDSMVLTEARLLETNARPGSRPLTLRETIDRALEANFDLVLEQLAADIAQTNASVAMAPLLPQVSVQAAGSLIDRDRARSSFGSNAELVLNLSATASQQLLSEPAWARYSIAEREKLAAMRLRDAVRLDIILAAARSFLDVLRAQINFQIERDNLRLTRRNLELAQVRRQAGSGTVADVHRFEAEVANNQSRVVDQAAAESQAEIALNRLLNREPEQTLLLTKPALSDTSLMVHFDIFADQLADERGFRIYREYLAQQALAVAPEFERAEALRLAAERAETSASRAFWMPLVELTGNLNRLTAAAGAGSENLGQGNFVSFGDADGDGMDDGFPVLVDRTTWNVMLTATYPLFSGGQRFDEHRRAGLQLRQERERQKQVSLNLRADVRSASHRARAAYFTIELSSNAAKASQKNLKIITERYARGAEDVVTLLDAQNNALEADLLASVAVIDFLEAYFELQRRSGRFDVVEDEASRVAWERSFRIFYGERLRDLNSR